MINAWLHESHDRCSSSGARILHHHHHQHHHHHHHPHAYYLPFYSILPHPSNPSIQHATLYPFLPAGSIVTTFPTTSPVSPYSPTDSRSYPNKSKLQTPTLKIQKHHISLPFQNSERKKKKPPKPPKPLIPFHSPSPPRPLILLPQPSLPKIPTSYTSLSIPKEEQQQPIKKIQKVATSANTW